MLILMMIEDMLADLGCESVTVASKVGTAISLIEGQEFDTAMLDLNLNGIESYPVADALAARDVPYFFLTGNSLTDMKDGYRDRHVLSKPFTFEQLSGILSRSLGENNAERPRH